MKRLSIAFRCFFVLLFTGKISEKIFAELGGRVKPATSPEGTREAAFATTQPPASAPLPADAPRLRDGTERAIQLLALLQRDGRLVDFFTEDITSYDDAQVGAAVRDMHESCRATLRQYLTIEPVVSGEEGQPVTIESGFEPGTIKLIGNVTGRLPARGVLRHHGWQARETRLPDLPPGAARAVIAQAEVEIS
jgi:hypothetical protein